MPLLLLPRLAAITVLFLAMTCSLTSANEDLLTVKLSSGRQFSGAVDNRTDAKSLWLRYGTDGITVLRPIDWKRVVSANHQNQDVPLDQLRQLAFQIKTEEQPAPPLNAAPKPVATNSMLTQSERARRALGAAPRIRSVQFDAFLANWDADVEADGLVVDVLPLSGSGRLTAINGTVQIELFALQKRRFQDIPRGRGTVSTRIGSWSRRFSADQVGASGLRFKLPFQAIHPEFNGRVGTHGLVHVRLVAPGHGVFEHSQDAIRIRTFAPLRDHLERNGRDRFLPSEMLGRSR